MSDVKSKDAYAQYVLKGTVTNVVDNRILPLFPFYPPAYSLTLTRFCTGTL